MENILNVAVMQAPGSLLGPQSRIHWLKSVIDAWDNHSVDLLVLPELYLTGYNIGAGVEQWADKRDGAFSRQIADRLDLTAVKTARGRLPYHIDRLKLPGTGPAVNSDP